jgi:polyhydroxyalkanoate synthesis regulator phasin
MYCGYILKFMDEVKKMLRSVINGQSALKDELLNKINALDKKVDEQFSEVNTGMDDLEDNLTRRIDNLGKGLAYLEDDAPTREEHAELEGRVVKIENKLQI